MAKYTELLAEYLETGGELPPEFSIIDGFEDLFKLKYYDKEIGFETEELFKMKLFLTAQLKIPFYKKRLDIVNTLLNSAIAGKRLEKVKYTFDAQTGYQWELPFNNNQTTATATNKTRTDGFENEQEKEISGYTSSEVKDLLEYYNGDVKNIIEQLLDEFKSCFMLLSPIRW